MKNGCQRRNVKLLLEIVIYMATMETATCIIAIEIIIYIMLCREYYFTIATETPTCIISAKIVTHIFNGEIIT